MDSAAAAGVGWTRRPTRTRFYDETREVQGTGDGRWRGTYQTGLFGEEFVADALQRAGWTVLGHRVRTRVGELDLIVRRGPELVFVEVKAAGPGRLEVETSIGRRSRQRLRRAAVAWMSMRPDLHVGIRRYRFDVYFVHHDGHGGIERVEHLRDAF